MFYPDNSRELRVLIDESFRDQRFGPGRVPPSSNKRKIYGIVSPHAGYVYSGAVAANGFYEASSMDFKDVVMVGPNHYGIGSWVAAMKEGEWETPLGEVLINSELANEIASRSSILDFAHFAHSRDHSLEVQLQLLEAVKQDVRKVPMVLACERRGNGYELGNDLSERIRNKDRTDSTMLIASYDFKH